MTTTPLYAATSSAAGAVNQVIACDYKTICGTSTLALDGINSDPKVAGRVMSRQ